MNHSFFEEKPNDIHSFRWIVENSSFLGRLVCAWIFLILSNTTVYAKPIKIVCSTDNPKKSLHVIALERFGKLLEQHSGGQLTTQIHYRGNSEYPAIRGEETNMNMVMSGERDPASGLKIHVTVIAAGNASQKAPVLNFLMLPYFFPEESMAKQLFEHQLMRTEINQTLAKKHGVRALAWLIGGYRNMTNSIRPVSTLNDIRGLTIRTPRNRLMKSTYEAFGARVKTINWSDTFDALKNGQVDGQENPYNVIFYSEFWTANQKYVTKNAPFLWVGPILINETFYQSLSTPHKEAVENAAREAELYEWQWIADKNKFLVEQLVAKGMKIQNLSDKSEWIKAAKPIWGEYFSNIGYGNTEAGKALVERILALRPKK